MKINHDFYKEKVGEQVEFLVKDENKWTKKYCKEYEDSELTYFTDQEFYVFYQIYKLVVVKENYSSFELDYLQSAPGMRDENPHSTYTTWQLLCRIAQQFGLELELEKISDGKFSKSLYADYLWNLQKKIEAKPEIPGNKLIKKFLDNTITTKELYDLFIFIHLEFEVILDYSIFRFKKPDTKTVSRIGCYFLRYLEKFSKDNLKISTFTREKYFAFVIQLNILLDFLKNQINFYPASTIVTLTETHNFKTDDPFDNLVEAIDILKINSSKDKGGSVIDKGKKYSEFLPVHTLAFLELIQAIDILQIHSGSLDWMESMDLYDMGKEESLEVNGYRAEIEVKNYNLLKSISDEYDQLKFGKKIQSEQKNETTLNNEIYEYHDYNKNPMGLLRIGKYPEIHFNKTPAVIIHYFYESSKLGNSHKNYKDFNEFLEENRLAKKISSDDFNKKIEAINKRVSKETKKMIKEIITKGENKKQEANIYKWNDPLTRL